MSRAYHCLQSVSRIALAADLAGVFASWLTVVGGDIVPSLSPSVVISRRILGAGPSTSVIPSSPEVTGVVRLSTYLLFRHSSGGSVNCSDHFSCHAVARVESTATVLCQALPLLQERRPPPVKTSASILPTLYVLVENVRASRSRIDMVTWEGPGVSP
jgi:hypothetical protein